MTEPSDDKTRVGRDSLANTAFDPNGPIGRKLKSFYDVIETEPVPEKLLDLLEQLDEAERKAKADR